jgi:hypothetical protein
MMLLLPVLSLFLDVYFGILRECDFIVLIQMTALGLLVTYPIVNSIVTIYFVTPYRDAVIAYLSQLAFCRRQYDTIYEIAVCQRRERRDTTEHLLCHRGSDNV